MENYFETDFNVINGPWQRGSSLRSQLKRKDKCTKRRRRRRREAGAVRVDGEGGGVTVKVSLGRGQIICSHLDSAQSNRLKFEVTFCQLPSLVVTHPCHVLPQQPPKLSTAKN